MGKQPRQSFNHAGYLRGVGRQEKKLRQRAEEVAKMTSLPVQHSRAAGIDVGDRTHWVCIDCDGGPDTVREFPAHTPGLRAIVAWLREVGVTTVAASRTIHTPRFIIWRASI